ncbi:MAG: hypothetical protein H0U49_06865 [Parachlamydiaceae bacterium]|nr:hypothetical protein [Parachlamydiaceae bacterium]
MIINLFTNNSNFEGVLPKICDSPFKKRMHVYDQDHLNVNAITLKRFKKEEVIIPRENSLINLFDIKTKLNLVISFQMPHIQIQALEIASSKDYSNSSQSQQKKIDSLIYSTCSNYLYNNNDKFVELGILFYYVASQKEIPVGLGLKEYRIHEIESEIKNLKEIHQKVCPQTLLEILPSGSSAYLIRAFVRMIFPPNGSFNLGGCQAVLNFMDTRLALYLTEEARLQIIKTLKRLMIDPEFQKYFLQTFEVKEEFKQIILDDVKESNKGPFSFIFVRWALLMVLFKPLSQNKEPNCYAVATLSNLINDQHNCTVILSILIEVLKFGSINFENTRIPAMPLFESRLIYEKDFNSNLTFKSLDLMTIFSVVKECLNRMHSVEHPETLVPINDIFETEFGVETKSAKQIIFSFKRVLLQELMLSIVQFFSCNSLRPSHLKKINGPIDAKEKLLDLIIKNVFPHSATNSSLFTNEDFKTYKSNFYASLEKVLFLLDFTNSEVKIEGNRVIFENHEKGFLIKYKSSDYDSFKDERRLCMFDGDELLPIDTLKDFQNVIYKIATKLSKDYNLYEHPWMKIIFELIKSENFRVDASKIVHEFNQKESILTANDYFKSDSFFLIQDGGYTDSLSYYEPFTSIFEENIVFKPKSIEIFFNTLTHHISVYATRYFKVWNVIDLWVLIESKDHSFNARIYDLKEYLVFGSKTLNKNIIDPAKRIQVLNPVKIKRILDRTLDAKLAEDLYKKLSTKRSIIQFSKSVRASISIDLHSELNTSVENSMNEISLSDVKKRLPALIFKICEFGDYEPYLKNTLKGLEHKLNDEFVLPIELALIIQKSLLLNLSPMFKPVDIIENDIRSFFSLPEVVKVANLNWTGKSKKFKYLFLEYSYVDNGVVLNKRSGDIDQPLFTNFTNSLFKETTLRFSK